MYDETTHPTAPGPDADPADDSATPIEEELAAEPAVDGAEGLGPGPRTWSESTPDEATASPASDIEVGAMSSDTEPPWAELAAVETDVIEDSETWSMADVPAADEGHEAEPATDAQAEPTIELAEPATDAEAEPAVELAEPVTEPADLTESQPVAASEATAEPSPAPTPERLPVGRHVARMLHAAGIRWAFTVPGESFLGLLDELTGAGIHVVGTRHESGAAFMAEAVGQLTGRPALCLATRAVGGANLGIGIHTALADSTPLVAVVGQVPSPVRGREAFQEADLVASLGGFAKWAAEPSSAEETPTVVGEALHRAASGRPGPVVLSFPEDLLDEELVASAPVAANPGPAARPDPVVVRSILRMLADAERPVILAGAGVLRARCSSDLTRLAEFLRVPVIASWRRGDVISNEHPLFLGMTGFGAPPVVAERLASADVALVLGSRLNEITTGGYAFPHAGQRWAHVDLEPRGGGTDLPGPELAVAADARAFVRAALERLRGAALDAAVADARGERNVLDRATWEAATVVDAGQWDGPGLHPGRVVSLLRSLLPDDAIVTTDAGNMSGWLARGFRFRRPGTFLGPTSGAMGYGLPAAIAAALVHRDRTIVAWAGDGGFAMTMAELETAVRMRLRLTVIVLDNERYGTIRMHQELRGVAAPAATDLGPIDFASVARGLGAHGSRPTTEAELQTALRAALVADRPSVIQVPLDRRWVSVDRPAV